MLGKITADKNFIMLDDELEVNYSEKINGKVISDTRVIKVVLTTSDLLDLAELAKEVDVASSLMNISNEKDSSSFKEIEKLREDLAMKKLSPDSQEYSDEMDKINALYKHIADGFKENNQSQKLRELFIRLDKIIDLSFVNDIYVKVGLFKDAISIIAPAIENMSKNINSPTNINKE